MIDIASVLIQYFPESRWELEGFEYEGLNWLSDDQKPKESELSDLWVSLLSKRAQDQKMIEDKNKEIENKLLALGLSLDDMKTIMGV